MTQKRGGGAIYNLSGGARRDAKARVLIYMVRSGLTWRDMSQVIIGKLFALLHLPAMSLYYRFAKIIAISINAGGSDGISSNVRLQLDAHFQALSVRKC